MFAVGRHCRAAARENARCGWCGCGAGGVLVVGSGCGGLSVVLVVAAVWFWRLSFNSKKTAQIVLVEE